MAYDEKRDCATLLGNMASERPEESGMIAAASQQPAANQAKVGTRKMPLGMPCANLTEVERQVPLDEPPTLPLNKMLSVIGHRTLRSDGRLKVTGAAKYTADVRLPGMLYAHVVTSPYPHARIVSIDTGAAEKHPSVRAVHVIDRVLGSAEVRDKTKEIQSKYPIVRYAGQPIAAVAARTRAEAIEAAALIRVEYEQLPFVIDKEKARNADAPLVFPAAADQDGTAGGGGGPSGIKQTGNVRGPVVGGGQGRARGDIAKGFAEAEVTVEVEYRTQVQTHAALETHGVVADWKTEGLTVYASTQGTESVRDELAAVFNLKKSQVRVITEFMGGGFGAKFGAGNEGVIATQLSKKAGAPVWLMFDRKQEHLTTGNRPDSVQRLRIGAKKDGTLTAMHLVAYGTAGTGTGAGVAGPVQNMYACANVKTEESDVFTHAGPAAAFRAPGHPQGCFALEQAIDELAEKLKMNPLALREKIDESQVRREERRIGAEKIGWARRREPGADSGPIKRGIGFAQSIWYRFVDRDSACEVRITRDGSVELMSGVQDIGSGIRTVLAQIVAEELGLAARDITVRIGDTNFPVGPASGGSVTTGSITPAARNAAWKVKQQFLDQVAIAIGAVAGSEIVMRDGRVFLKSDPTKSLSFKQAAAKMKTEQVADRASRVDDYAVPGPRRPANYCGVQFADVAVDVETGVIKVERVVAVHDCGRPINPLTIESQINGGVIQGISYALFENRLLDRSTGLMVNPNLEQYKIAGSREVPQIEIVLVEEYLARSSTDAGGIGEPATIATAAAVANAVYNAIGVRLREIPMTPARVLAALNQGRRTV